MVKKDLILVGGGGHCKACIDVIESEGKFNVAGIVDTVDRLQQKVLGYKIIASDQDFKKLTSQYQYFLITLGSIKDPSQRIAKFECLKRLGALFPVCVSSLAHVSKSAEIAQGTVVMHQAIVNADAVIGENCIINTSAIIEHEVKIGEHGHISTGSIINGKCRLGSRVFIGSNTTVVHQVKITDDVVIGAGSVVTRSIDRAGVYVGNPARRVKE